MSWQILTILLLCWPITTRATLQQPDRIFYGNDTIYINDDFPLEKLYGWGKQPVFFENDEISTGCYRGYTADWMIINNELYLVSINSCKYMPNEKASLQRFFGDQVLNSMVKADWLTDTIVGSFNLSVLLTATLQSNGLNKTEDYELELQFNRGRLIKTERYHNYSLNMSRSDKVAMQSLLHEYINWQQLTLLNNDTVVVAFYTNQNAQVDSAVIIRTTNNNLDSEALRVVYLLPKWDVFYYRGSYRQSPSYVKLVFNEDNRRFYSAKYKRTRLRIGE